MFTRFQQPEIQKPDDPEPEPDPPLETEDFGEGEGNQKNVTFDEDENTDYEDDNFTAKTTISGKSVHRKTRRDRVKSTQYQCFVNLQMQDKAKILQTFIIIFLVISLTLFVLMLFIMITFTYYYSGIWQLAEMTLCCLSFFTGSLINSSTAVIGLYLRNRTRGYQNSSKYIYSCAGLGAVGTILQMIFLEMFRADSLYNSLDTDEECHLHAWLILRETIEGERAFCSVWTNVDVWNTMKGVFAVTACIDILWCILLTYYCFKIRHFLDPDEDVWQAYRHYRKLMREAKKLGYRMAQIK